MCYAYYMQEKTYGLNQKKNHYFLQFRLFYTLISSNTTLRYMFAQGRTDERTQTIIMQLRRFAARTKRVYGLNIYKPEITEFKRMGDRHQDKWTFGLMDLRTNEPSDQRTFGPMNLRTNATEPGKTTIYKTYTYN